MRSLFLLSRVGKLVANYNNYYDGPYGPSRGVRSVYTALVLVLNFTTNLLVNC